MVELVADMEVEGEEKVEEVEEENKVDDYKNKAKEEKEVED